MTNLIGGGQFCRPVIIRRNQAVKTKNIRSGKQAVEICNQISSVYIF